MYKIDLRDEDGNIISKEFSSIKKAEDFYADKQSEFNFIEMRMLKNNEVIDHCYLLGSKLKPIWIGE